MSKKTKAEIQAENAALAARRRTEKMAEDAAWEQTNAHEIADKASIFLTCLHEALDIIESTYVPSTKYFSISDTGMNLGVEIEDVLHLETYVDYTHEHLRLILSTEAGINWSASNTRTLENTRLMMQIAKRQTDLVELLVSCFDKHTATWQVWADQDMRIFSKAKDMALIQFRKDASVVQEHMKAQMEA